MLSVRNTANANVSMSWALHVIERDDERLGEKNTTRL